MNIILKRHIFFLLLILFSSFFLIIAEEKTFDKSESLVFSRPEGNKYVELLLEGNNDSKYVLSVYSDSQKTKRIQLGQSFKRKIKLYLSLRNYKGSNIYTEVECPNGSVCSGKVICSYCPTIELKEGEPISYYVNEETEQLEFNLNINSTKINLWVRGQYTIKTYVEEKNKKTIENRGDFYIIERPIGSPLSFSALVIKGDYINVGYIGYKKNEQFDSNANIEIDGPSLTGYLKKGILDEICYNINEEDILKNELVLGNGIIFTKIGYSYIAYKSGKEYPTGSLYTSGFIKNGLFFPEDNEEEFKICITFPKSDTNHTFDKVDEIVFVYQLEKATQKDFTLYEPQLNGVLYPRTILKGSKTAFISQNNGNFKKMSLNLMSLTGFPKMYVIECNNYPLCNYDDATLNNNNTIRPRNINRFSSYYVDKKQGENDSPISKKQTVFVVECMESQKRKEDILPEYMDYICEYNTLIYKDTDFIELIEENYFNQFTLQDQVHNYKIKIGKESGIKKIFIDIMIYVGDVHIDYPDFENKDVKADLYYQINKIFISAKFNDNSEKIDDLIFSIKGLNNTYYSILITFANEENNFDSFITNKLQTGMSYLVTVDTSQFDESGYANKIIKFKNERVYDLIPFLVNFYSLNCDIEGIGLYNNLVINMEKFEQFSQDVVDSNEDRYLSSEYEYRINVKSKDPSQYKGNLCKLYVSAIELRDSHETFSRDILVPDNTPQQIRFGNDVKHVSFGYIHVDFQYDLLIKFNLKHIAQYTVDFYYENHKRRKSETIVANNMLILHSREWSSSACKDKTRVCYITLDITLSNVRQDNDKPVLEFSIKSMETHSVDYIPKDQLKIDYVKNNEPQNYYTEIGANEVGFIMANFLRGSGQVFARIVKNTIDAPEKPAVWRGKYRIPNDNDIKIEPFTKELSFVTYDDCEKGCYLLLSVFSDVKGYDYSFDRYYTYSLMVHSSPNNRNYKEVPIIKIPVDEYIIGTVEPSNQNNRMFLFYSVWLNYDADQVIIDFQSDAGGIFINVGETRPTTESAHFKFWPNGNDTIHTINKEQIIQNAKESQKEKGLKDIILTIGIWTNMTDSIFTTPFSFAVRLEDDKEDEIYRVNSDQKVLCNPKKKGDIYRCVYVIDYNYVHDFSGVFIYANVQDKSALFNIYGQYIDAVKYEMSPKIELNNLIPSKTNNYYSTESEQSDYLYIYHSSKPEEYILLSVEATKETIIEFMTTLLIYQEEISPNPSSPQLYSAFPGHKFYLNLPTNYMEMVNIICLGGEGRIYWNFDDKNIYNLKGRDDRLSITSNKSMQSHKLHIESIGESNTTAFVFIVEYNIRLDHVNFDLLNLEKSINYVYVDSDFPITYYTPLTKLNEISTEKNDFYDIFFTFDKLESIVDKSLTYYENQPFTIHGFIVKESLVYESRLTPEVDLKKDNRTIIGFYDQALRTGLIRITQEQIKQSNIPEYERPYLYLELDKSESFKDIRRYKRVSLETSVSYKNSKLIISEVSNQFGYLSSNQNEANYVLRKNNKYKYMFIEFSCMDDNLLIEIQQLNLNSIPSYGKTIYYIETRQLRDTNDLVIKRKQKNTNEEYFLFRYYFEETLDKIQNKYSIKDKKPKVIHQKYNSKSVYIVDVSPLEIANSNSKEYNITYIVRLVAEENLKPKNANLALKPVKQSIKEFYDPKNTKFEITLEKSKDIKYIEVILQIKYNETLEYLSYEVANNFKIEIINDENKNNDNDKSKAALIACIVIGIILFIIVIVLIIVIIIFNNKNKDLLEKVNKVSFADSDQRGDDDLLLSKD